MRPGLLTSPTAATKTTLRTLARRWQQLQAELDQLDTQLQALVTSAAPTLVALPGVGVETAGQLLVTAATTPSGWAPKPPSRIYAAPLPSQPPRVAPTSTG
jgi:transposase